VKYLRVKQQMRMLTSDFKKGYSSLKPGALVFCYGSAIMLMAEHTWKTSKNDLNGK